MGPVGRAPHSRRHGGIQRIEPFIPSLGLVKGQLLWLAIIAMGAEVRAQNIGPWDQETEPWLVEAWEAGCIAEGEWVALNGMGRGGWTQQRVVRLLGAVRGASVVRCLLAQGNWPPPSTPVPTVARDARADVRTAWSGQGLPDLRARFRRREAGWTVQGRWDGPGQGAAFSGAAGVPGRKGVWQLGTLSPQIGQGEVFWTSRPFDDLGGMEGSHRMPSGWLPSAGRWRGCMDGVAWQRAAPRRGRIAWAAVAKLWQGAGWTAGVGGVGPFDTGWSLRRVPMLSGRWAPIFGVHGGGERGAKSLRWGASVFRWGWTARVSLLWSWTSQWEGHVLLERSHPHDPRWSSGEQRASTLDPGSRPWVRSEAGIQWAGVVSGGLRVRRRTHPEPDRPDDHRTVLTMAWRAHRLTVVQAVQPTGPSGPWSPEWSVRHRVQWEEERWAWRLTGAWSGAGGRNGGVLAAALKVQGWQGTRWSFGCGQAWGHPGAPPRYVTGWDRRPARAFRDRDAEVFVRMRSPTGRWQVRIGWTLEGPALDSTEGLAIHPRVDVEFQPHQKRRSP